MLTNWKSSKIYVIRTRKNAKTFVKTWQRGSFEIQTLLGVSYSLTRQLFSWMTALIGRIIGTRPRSTHTGIKGSAQGMFTSWIYGKHCLGMSVSDLSFFWEHLWSFLFANASAACPSSHSRFCYQAGNRSWWHIFQYDGAFAHFAKSVGDWLDQTFPNRLIGRGTPLSPAPIAWLPRSPDLALLDFFGFGTMRHRVFCPPRPLTPQDLRNRVAQFWNGVTPQQLQNVRRAFCDSVYHCLAVNGEHFEHLIWNYVRIPTTHVISVVGATARSISSRAVHYNN